MRRERAAAKYQNPDGGAPTYAPGPRFRFAGMLTDPRTGARRTEAPALHDAGYAERRLQRLAGEQPAWAALTSERRATRLARFGESLLAHRDELAATASREMGKNRHEALAEVEKCASLAQYCARAGAAALRPIDLPTAPGEPRATRHYRPLGTVLGIMPWNFPFWQVARFALPALVAGNAVALKHARNVPACAARFVALLRAALGESDVVADLRLDDETTLGLIGLADVHAVSLTGSPAAGRAVAAAAGGHLKPVVLELGGSDAYLILEDADLDAAAATCFTGRLVNAGQSCIGPKRIVVVGDDRYAAVADRMLALAGAVEYAGDDPADDRAGRLAPLARVDLRGTLHGQVRRSVAAGAVLLHGGVVPDRAGAWYPVTVLGEVRPGMPAFDEELFGPVLSLVRARTRAEAVELANRSAFGLGAGVFTADERAGRELAVRELRAGAVAVNDFVRSDPRYPFGGVGESGFGRELGRAGFRAFCYTKVVVG